MIKIRMLETDQVLEVTRNVAHGLLDAGEAEVFTEKQTRKNTKRKTYRNKMMRTE